MEAPAYNALACTVWIAIWWITEAVPIPATSLLPLVLYPLTGVMTTREAALPYSTPIIYLFVGGFILALAMERWNLHRRIALSIISKIGTNQKQIILGFILATGFLSMWISNTATTVMMLPIALSIITQFQSFETTGDNKTAIFGKALILSIAYSASIGGMATLVGTPTNLIFADSVKQIYNMEIPFDQWLWIGMPISAVLLFVCWWHLTNNAFNLSNKVVPGSSQIIRKQLAALGKMKIEEKRVLLVFVLVALAWISRRYLISPFFRQ